MYKKTIWLIGVITLCMALTCIHVQANIDGPPITAPVQFGEFKLTNLTLSWNPPPSQYGTVSYYIINVRDLGDPSQETSGWTGSLTVSGVTTISRSYTIAASQLNLRHKYRVSICAVMTNFVQRYSDEGYFYITTHNGINTMPLTMTIWNGFETATKNAVYFSHLPWTSAIGIEVTNTSGSYHNSNSIDNNDNVNRVTGVNLGTSEYLAAVWRRLNSSNKSIEADMNINTAHPWANGSLPDRFDIQNVVTHEFGHVSGLRDKYDSWAATWTMYGGSSRGQISKRVLKQHDMDQSYRLYH